MKTVIEMAREAGFNKNELAYLIDNFIRFAELVRADALVKPCCGNFTQCHEVCMPRAAAYEREACAKVCEPQEEHDDPLTAWKIAAAIRARSNT